MAKTIVPLPKIKVVRSNWDAEGRIVKSREIEVQSKSLKDCEKLVDKYDKIKKD